MLGPDPLGYFQQITVKSIHRKRMAVKEVRAGQTASFALKKVTISFIFMISNQNFCRRSNVRKFAKGWLWFLPL